MPSEPSSLLSTDFQAAYRAGALDDFFELPRGAVERALEVERPVKRSALAAALRRNARRLGAPQAVHDNIDKLEHPRALAVVTGQQVGLMLGPTFTLSKAVTAIRLAERLDSPERPVVPLFWLATQDHDAAEIDHTYLLDASETLHRIEVPLPEGVPAGRMPVSREMVATVVGALGALSPRPPFLEQTVALLEETAAAGGYGDWFAAQLLRLLGGAGLVPVDPLQPDFAGLTVPLLRQEISRPEESSRAINAAGDRLKALGFEPQLGRGVNATNLFIELPDESGPEQRSLLKHAGGRFEAAGRLFTAEELLARLDADPTVITPAAGLRPVVQDASLPTALFVIGPGELRYVAQLKEVYRMHGVPMPLVWPRASATVLEPAARRLLGRFGLSAARFRQARQAELERIALERSGHLERFERTTDLIEEGFAALLEEVAGIDPTLTGTVDRGRRHLDLTLERLRSKSARAFAERDATTRRQFERLAAHLLPTGAPAERVLSPFSHALKFGLEPLLDRFMRLEPEGEQELLL